MKLRPVVEQAIKSGPVPKLRDWRKLPTSKLTRAERNMKFCERYLRVPEGDLVGQPIKLADFQEAFFYAVYDNKVLTKRAILSMARKNSKTGTIAMIVLVHLVGPEAKQNSRIASGARSRKQAAEVYNYAAKMAALSPDLKKRVRPVPSAKRLHGVAMNVEYDAVSAEGSTAHGGSYIVVVLDEVGQVKGPQDDFVDAMVTSQGAYSDGLLFVISTQAPTDADMMSILIDDAERANDPTTVCHVYAAPKDCDLLDPKALEAANPALGLFRSRSDAEDQLNQAARMPSKESTTRVLILNQRQNMVAALVSASVWKRGNIEPAPWDQSAIYGGLDLSATTDLTSLVLTQRQSGVLMVRAWFWMPEDTCIHLARAQMRALGHKPPAVPRFYSAIGAMKALRGTGHATLEALLDALLPRIAPAAMWVGDLALMESGTEDPFDAIVVSTGQTGSGPIGGGQMVAGYHAEHLGSGIVNIIPQAFKGAWRL